MPFYIYISILYLSKKLDINLAKFQNLVGIIMRILLNKIRPEIVLEFYKPMAIPPVWYCMIHNYGL